MGPVKAFFLPITEKEIPVLQKFINDAGTSLDSFRYFSKRPFSAIKDHIVTALLMENDDPVGYGHLDKDKDTVWLGIAVKHTCLGLGYGRVIMQYLIDSAKINEISVIHLTVDKENERAINLYKKFGFKQVDKNSFSPMLMKLTLNVFR